MPKSERLYSWYSVSLFTQLVIVILLHTGLASSIMDENAPVPTISSPALLSFLYTILNALINSRYDIILITLCLYVWLLQ